MARNQKRDKNGRFAGGGGKSGGGKAASKATGGTLAARSSLKRSKGKAAANASPQQRGAVTRGTNKPQAAKAASRRTVKGAPQAGTMRGRIKRNPAAGSPPPSANGIRRTGGLKRPVAANGVKPIRRRPKPANAIKPSPRRGSLPAKGQPLLRDRLSSAKGKANTMGRRMARQSARDIAGRLKGGIDGMMSGIMQQNQGRRLNAAGQNQIRRRAARATASAARGSKPAARAREIYGAQLASTGPGKGSKARNNVQPGPRNTKGKPRKARKPKG